MTVAGILFLLLFAATATASFYGYDYDGEEESFESFETEERIGGGVHEAPTKVDFRKSSSMTNASVTPQTQ